VKTLLYEWIVYNPTSNVLQNPNFLVAMDNTQTATNGGLLMGDDGGDTKKLEMSGANNSDRRRLRIATRSSAISGAGDTEIFMSNMLFCWNML
jgi:hypothetical protein